VANPNLLSSLTLTQEILVESQLASGNNDFTVPTGRAWTIKSFVACNVSGTTVTLNAWVIKTGGTARKIMHNLAVNSGDTAVIDPDILAMLPESATLRLNSSAATALDVTITGAVSG
jgi:hypothetical protein